MSNRLTTLVSLLRGRRQPVSSRDEPVLAEVARDARKPSARAERRPTSVGEKR